MEYRPPRTVLVKPYWPAADSGAAVTHIPGRGVVAEAPPVTVPEIVPASATA